MSNDDSPATEPAPTPRLQVLPTEFGYILRDHQYGMDYPFLSLATANLAATKAEQRISPLGLIGSPIAINTYEVSSDAPDLRYV